MARKALEDQKYEMIKAHVLDPEHSPLPPDQREQLDRVMSMARLLDRQPIQRNAVALHMKKYKGVRRTQAYEDCRIAVRLFNSLHSFDYDFWHQWLINDIIRNIERCNKSNNVKAMRVIAAEHANLIKAIGEKPQKEIDPKLTETHNFFLQVNINGEQTLIDYLKLVKLPNNAKKALSDIMVKEIDITNAEELMNS
jgi:hypothetical protein